MEILELIKLHGCKATAIKSARITEITGVSGIDIRKEVNRLRRLGEPICSSNKGYYYSNSVGDMYDTISMLNNRVSSINEAVDGLLSTLMNKVED